MRFTVRDLVLGGAAVLSIASLAACARHDAATTTTTTTETQSASTAPSAESSAASEGPGTSAGPSAAGMRSSCDVLSASEVRGIVGSSVIAKETHVDGVQNSTCTYSGGETDSVFTVEIAPADKIESTIQKLQELVTASAGKEMVGRKGQMIVSVFNSNGKTKAIYDLALSKL